MPDHPEYRSSAAEALGHEGTVAGERWNWLVAGEDTIKAFRELLQRAQIGYTVVGPVEGSEVEWLAVRESV